MSWQVKFFQTKRSDYPVKDFIEKLDKPLYIKILRYIDLIRNSGFLLKPPYVKKIQDGIWELRITGKIQIRIIYSFFNNIFYLLHAFKKKKQKIPLKELSIALDRMKELI
ncbi:type II toxin-antitoxin system RelE/ParE family toxin [Candidatus Roizmanbacteria bacterium CG_4_10_14_0_2_um_filter_36_35]|uniref:Type II toxin-antitoxin system RelE/ParE family toxin n=4 Tax=Candidatus Roizmaniibacteriota TaxID=1752723 RepID=A0A2M7BX18_9BACT|nr:MAG: hypothetical protein COV86_00320 [Candidatus Roizmanbacteria bacterium CG11_big_fil_rev_8_21_14_0_20_35_14]PIV11079.1 MAG: type II toxin-antitoxin system RelE/ParE family toxin [Candidatus Roizmanbacteria bacterium CG03_land_8_20_14_0_80_35_26]PIZ67890.1 MAG: type II toxin-antitoxin system RelE/ParE family toxin [Candidatus Roizmanbacteria bacterium CG_4_10_14_0_2_um_filter_36_35]PJC32804.1 MAG: type II toxin-antitoxin system RelE/ParE family toxin [Candidatus Roizmanbacteria bacterium C